MIGPNGAGKTTLMRVISGLLQPSAGEITLSRAAARRLAGVPHRRAGYRPCAGKPPAVAQLTVEENLRIGAFIPSARARPFKERLAWVYDLFPRLRERRTQLAGTLSGGEQQMCAIGRALMSHPKLLLMDEPSAGLAPLAVEQVFDLVRRIRAEVHRADRRAERQQVLRLVDRAYLLEAGPYPPLPAAPPNAQQRGESAGR